MPCYHPYYATRDFEKGVNELGKYQYKILGLYSPEVKSLDPYAIKIPCGHCIGCRLDYSRRWADRMILELDHTKKGIFVTLTYNNEHVPFTEDEYTGQFGSLSLCKRDVQLFFKRLRKRFPEREIRYYIAGEYGPKTDRPHYHAVIFGIGLDDLGKRTQVGFNDLRQPWYTCEELEKAWSYYKWRKVPKYHKKTGKLLKSYDKEWYYDPIGFVSASEVSWRTCAYVTRYVQKKIFAVPSVNSEFFGAEPEFSLMSRRPGLGSYYCDDHPDWYELTEYYVPGKEDSVPIPNYFIKKLETYNPVLYDKIKSDRKRFSNDRELQMLQQTDLSFLEKMEQMENEKLSRIGCLTRDRVNKMEGCDVF